MLLSHLQRNARRYEELKSGAISMFVRSKNPSLLLSLFALHHFEQHEVLWSLPIRGCPPIVPGRCRIPRERGLCSNYTLDVPQVPLGLTSVAHRLIA